MKRFALAVITVTTVATVSVPAANAAPGLGELQPVGLEQEVRNDTTFSQDTLDDAAINVDLQRQTTFNDAADAANAQLREQLDKDAVLDVVVIGL